MKCISCGALFRKDKNTPNRSGYVNSHLCDYCKQVDVDGNKNFGLLDEPDIASILNPTGRTPAMIYD